MLRIISLMAIVLFFSCKSKNVSEPIVPFEKPKADSADFFPVTTFLQGQVATLQKEGMNPIQFTTVNNKKDSTWLAIEKIPDAVAPFLETLIDSVNLKDTFTQTGFLDETLHAYTFSYDPKVKLPDNYPLQHWDVYVDPDNNKVTRIYIVKKTDTATTLQLTWQTNAFCKMVWIKDGKTPTVEKEILIKWDF